MYRGIEFRLEFSFISEVRSLILYETKMMALTATATAKMRRAIILTLEMNNCHLVVRHLNKCNIKYSVYPQQSIEAMLLPIVNDICSNGIKADQVIIFCRTYAETLMHAWQI